MSKTFQQTTTLIASIILIICLVVTGVVLYRSKYNKQFPPVIADCPDYWLDRSEGDGGDCVNKKKLGTCNKDRMNFSGPFWTGNDGLCRKYRWARDCNLTWDGITNTGKPCK
jgi:hypothetical protein